MQRVLDLWKDDTAVPIGDAEAYLLGREYPLDVSALDNAQFSQDFRTDAGRLVWLMYRTQFPTPIPRDPQGPSPLLHSVNAFFRSGPAAIQASSMLESFSTDVGWGCMIRTGQSLLANALLRLASATTNGQLAENDGVSCSEPPTDAGANAPISASVATKSGAHSSPLSKSTEVYVERKLNRGSDATCSTAEVVEILRQFSDEPSSPYSIHNFVAHGAKHCGKLPGEWFGPSAVAACIAEFAKPQLSTYISQGMDIYEAEVLALQFPVLILCNLRLGINEINPMYYEGLRALLQNKYSVGIAGGRTSASHYFYGVQGNQLFYHDPHEPKPAMTAQSTADEILASVKSAKLRALAFSEMDPSMLAGFLLLQPTDFADFKSRIEQISSRERVIHISSGKPSMEMLNLAADSEDEAEMTASGANHSETDGGYVVCSTPEPEVAEPIEAKEPGEESMTEI